MANEISLEALCQEVVASAEAQVGREISDRLRNAFNALAEHPDRRQAVTILAGAIPQIGSPVGCGILAVWLGAGVENGIDPDDAIPRLIEALRNWMRKIPDDLSKPISAELSSGLEFLGQGIVAHISRSPTRWKQYGHDEQLMQELQRVEGVSAGCNWVYELLSRTSGSLIAIDVAERRAFRVEYKNLSNCFHLFTLLQIELAPRLTYAPRISQDLMEVATGPAMHDVTDAAWWHYGDGTSSEANILASIWGELSPTTIPMINSQQIMLLWPPLLSSRQWDGNFFRPFLMAAPPSLRIVEELPAVEVDQWWETLELPARLPEADTKAKTSPTEAQKQPWWKFW